MTPLPAVYWLIRTIADVPEDDRWLTEGERLTLSRLRFPKRRAEWRLGRWTAKRLILDYLRKSTEKIPSEVEIRAAADGAPEVFFDGYPAKLTISISHREEVGFSVLSPAGINTGCDLELIEPRSEAFIKDYFTEAEQERIAKAAPGDKDRLAVLTWSAKESALKALREGLRRDTRSVEVLSVLNRESEDWAAFTVQCRETNRKFYGWWRQLKDYILTMAADLPTEKPAE